jgi:membrane protease YdiL (CAAX protease family)
MYGAGTWIMVYSIKSKYNSNLNQMGINMLLWVKKSVQSIAIYAGFFPVLMVVAYIGVLFCFYIGVSPEAHPLVDILKEGQLGLFMLYIVTIAVIFAPVFEEILFRGLFYQSLKKRFGLWQAAIISSVLFSILHFNTAQFLPIFGLGILLCFVFEYTGSLVPVIVLHIFNNAFFLGLFFLIENNS